MEGKNKAISPVNEGKKPEKKKKKKKRVWVLREHAKKKQFLC